MENQPLVVEQAYDAPISKVWKALTDVNDMRKWYFNVSDFKPEVGFEFSFSGGSPEKQYLHLCKVTEVIPGKKIAYSWRYDGVEGISYVSFDLSEEEGKTKVTITHKGLETFRTDNKDFKRESFVGGWTYFLTKALPKYLDGVPE